MKMMLNNIMSRLLVALFIFVSFVNADQACIDINFNGKHNSEQGPLGYQNCNCTCEQYRWLIDGSCPTCLHKHSHGKTVGQTIEIKEWITGLTHYIQQKKLTEHVSIVEKTVQHN